MFDPDFDPLAELELCKHNIQQLAVGLNTGSELLKHETNITRQLIQSHKHQQAVIEQLQFQNRKMNELIDIMRQQISQQIIDIAEIKAKIIN